MLLEAIILSVGAGTNGFVMWKLFSVKPDITLQVQQPEIRLSEIVLPNIELPDIRMTVQLPNGSAFLADYKQCDSCKAHVARYEEQANGVIKCANCIAEHK